MAWYIAVMTGEVALGSSYWESQHKAEVLTMHKIKSISWSYEL